MKKGQLFFVCLAIFAIGLYMGSELTKYQELNWCVEKAVYMLHIQGYDIKMNTGIISAGLMKYQDRFDKWINISLNSSRSDF